jgi:hypothetical protein
MENEQVDFNINNYSKRDLEYFFKLDEIPDYNASNIESNAHEIQNQLLNGGSFDSTEKTRFINFIQQAKDRLLKHKRPMDIYEETPLSKTALLPDSAHSIEETPKTTFIYADPSAFYEGKMNPLNTRVLTRVLNIDTKFRPSLEDNSADFIIDLPMKFYKVVSMNISAIEIPIGFYGISEAFGNNFFTLEVNDGGALSRKVFTIEEGNYSNAELITAINTSLGSTAPNPADPFTCVLFSLNTINNKVTVDALTATLPTIVEIGLFFNETKTGEPDNSPLTSKLGYNLGFIKESYSGELTYTGESLIEPKSNKYLFLSIDDFQNNVSNNSFVSAFQDSFLDNNILARISTKLIYENVIINDDELLSEKRQYFGPVDIQRLHIRLYDEYGRVVNMNNMNYSFCITLEQLYKL